MIIRDVECKLKRAFEVNPEHTFYKPNYRFLHLGFFKEYAVFIHKKIPGEPLHFHVTESYDHLTKLWRLEFNDGHLPEDITDFQIIDENSGKLIKDDDLKEDFLDCIYRDRHFLLKAIQG